MTKADAKFAPQIVIVARQYYQEQLKSYPVDDNKELTKLLNLEFGQPEYSYQVVQQQAGIVMAGYFGINPPGFVAAVVAFAFGLAASSSIPSYYHGHL